MIPSSALAVGAHPDDIELAAGGTLAIWADAGASLTFCILTDGRLGSPDPAVDPDDVARRRAREAEEAAAIFGAEVVMFGSPDGRLEDHRSDATDALVRIIRDATPEVVLGHDPWRLYELHPDHRAAGFATCDAVVTAREHHAVPRTGTAHRATELWLTGTSLPDHFVDIAASLDRKIQALSRHESQFEHVPDWRDRVRSWNRAIGVDRGYRVAEAFRRIVLPGATAMMRA